MCSHPCAAETEPARYAPTDDSEARGTHLAAPQRGSAGGVKVVRKARRYGARGGKNHGIAPDHTMDVNTASCTSPIAHG
jgi:hypothetical protein